VLGRGVQRLGRGDRYIIGTILVWGAACMFFFPIIGHLLGMDPTQFGGRAATGILNLAQVAGAALRCRLIGRLPWGGLPGRRWWREWFFPGLPPRQRRIVRLLLWVSLGEFAIFLTLVLVLAFVP
jgi:hypothetical protein